MNEIKGAEKLAEQALRSLDNIQPLEVNDFIFTRIQSRMSSKRKVSAIKRVKILYRLSAVLVLFSMLNATTFYLFKPVKPLTVTKQKIKGISAFADEYQLESNSYNY